MQIGMDELARQRDDGNVVRAGAVGGFGALDLEITRAAIGETRPPRLVAAPRERVIVADRQIGSRADAARIDQPVNAEHFGRAQLARSSGGAANGESRTARTVLAETVDQAAGAGFGDRARWVCG